MFMRFFTELREAKVPVTLKEYLALMEAMDKGVIDRSVEDFYYLSRSALVKDEKNLDKFDRVFGHVFKGLEKESSILHGMTLEEDGSLDPKKVLSNLSKFPKEQREEILVRDLNELLYFQLFAVKNSLGPELEAGIVEMAKSLLSPT